MERISSSFRIMSVLFAGLFNGEFAEKPVTDGVDELFPLNHVIVLQRLAVFARLETYDPRMEGLHAQAPKVVGSRTYRVESGQPPSVRSRTLIAAAFHIRSWACVRTCCRDAIANSRQKR